MTTSPDLFPLQTSKHVRVSTVGDPNTDPHLTGEYFRNNPTWHVEYSPWKAENIHRLIARKNLSPKTICEVGCGAGEVLKQLQTRMDPSCKFWGFDIAPPAIEMARRRENDQLRFALADFGEVSTPRFDMLLILEVVDHVEDYLGFLRMLRPRAEWKLFSFSLDISVQSALRVGAFNQRRNVHSHLHHFNKETALATLQYAGYEIVEHSYVAALAFSRLAKLAKRVRVPLANVAPDLTVRLFGGYSLFVLAR